MANRSSSFIEIEAGSRMIVRNDITKVKADVIVNTEYESGAGIYHGTSSKFFERSRDILFGNSGRRPAKGKTFWNSTYF